MSAGLLLYVAAVQSGRRPSPVWPEEKTEAVEALLAAWRSLVAARRGGSRRRRWTAWQQHRCQSKTVARPEHSGPTQRMPVVRAMTADPIVAASVGSRRRFAVSGSSAAPPESALAAT